MIEKKTYRVPSKQKAIEIIKSHIIRNQLKAGDLLPSERSLSEMYGISRTTFRSAIEQLKKEFLLYSKAGVGTFYAGDKFALNLLDAKSTSEVVKNSGRSLTTEVISSEIIEANKEIALTFKTVLGEPFFELIRCRIVDGIPLFLETSIIDYKRFPGIEKYDFNKESLFYILENKYHVKISRGTESLGITFPTNKESEILNISPKTPIYFIQSINYDTEDQVMEFSKHIVRADKVKYFSEYSSKGVHDANE